jgi:hypothetical protein
LVFEVHLISADELKVELKMTSKLVQQIFSIWMCIALSAFTATVPRRCTSGAGSVTSLCPDVVGHRFNSPATLADYWLTQNIMTFMMSREGVIFQKDLGSKTSDIAAAIKEYNPAQEWQPVE